MNRRDHLRRLCDEAFDVVVIGGGVTGAAAARDAARRGFRTALVEARDFGQGTSSRSSRLVHGGLRYLEHLELDLVFEASQERRTLLHIAPHMVRPLEFLFPLYEEGRVGKRKLDAGMWLYDALSLFRNIERHQMLDEEEVLAAEPALRREGLLGGARYYDAQVDDARLVLATVTGAAEAGAAVASRVEAVGLERTDGAVSGVRVRDLEADGPARRARSPGRAAASPERAAEPGGDTGSDGPADTDADAEWTVPARVVLNATGPWTEETVARAGRRWSRELRPTRGSHIHIDRDRLDHERALIFESPLDRRIMFVLPWGDLTLVGTTDRDYDGDPADVVPTAEDVTYLLESANRLFPDVELEPDDVVAAWAGLRPLVVDGSGGGDGAGDAGDGGAGNPGGGGSGGRAAGAESENGAGTRDEGDVSRDFVITEDAPGMLTIAGGKLTSHRHMAEKLVDRAASFLERAFDLEARQECDTQEVPLPGGEFRELDAFCAGLRERAAPHRLPGSTVDRLARAYGTRAGQVLELLDGRPGLREPLASDRPYLAAEAVHAARREMALHVEDVVFRRTRLGWEVRHGLEDACRRVARLMGEELGWGDARRGAEVARALEVRRRDEAFRAELEASWEG